MKCPVCRHPIKYKGGENKKDFGCSNYYCSSRTDAHYYTYLSINPDWYFAEAYHLPFKSQEKWFALVGPEYDWNWDTSDFKQKTILQEIIPITIGNYSTSSQKNLISIPYMALPTNDDFLDQFQILVEKAMGKFMLK